MQEFDLKSISTTYSEIDLIERIWSLGPRNFGTNILLNLSDYKHPNFWSVLGTDDDDSVAKTDAEVDVRRDYNSSFVNGFQVTTAAGPLCEEPMQGVCFVVLEWSVDMSEDLNSKTYGPFSGAQFFITQFCFKI